MNENRDQSRSYRGRLSKPFIAVCFLLAVIGFLASTNGVYHSLLRKVGHTTIEHDPIIGSADIETETNSEDIPVENVNNDPNSSSDYLAVDSFTASPMTADDMHNGDLVLVDDSHPYIGDTSDFTDYNQETINGYWVSTYNLSFQKKMASGISELAQAYNDNHNNDKRFFVYNTSSTDTSAYPLCAEIIPERASGYSIDLALKADGAGAVSLTDDVADWLRDNCSKYGFVLRYSGDSLYSDMGNIPYHFRYVGKANASLMTELKMDLEEYLEFLKGYSYDSPYCFTANGYSYEIFYTESSGETTDVPVPKNNDYYISGNNVDGFIEIVVISGPNG